MLEGTTVARPSGAGRPRPGGAGYGGAHAGGKRGWPSWPSSPRHGPKGWSTKGLRRAEKMAKKMAIGHLLGHLGGGGPRPDLPLNRRRHPRATVGAGIAGVIVSAGANDHG